MKYHLRVYDNSHHMDESEAYDHGKYETYEEAEIAARGIVNEFLHFNWRKGITSEELIEYYCLHGEDPVILPEKHPEEKGFSARDYVNEVAEIICNNLEKQL
jgi:hypothetical protein